MLILCSDLSGQGRHQVGNGVAFGENAREFTLGSGQGLAGDTPRSGHVGAAQGVERGSCGRAGAQLLTAAAIAGGQRFVSAGRGLLEEGLQHSQSVGVMDRRQVVGAEASRSLWMLAAASCRPLHQQLAVGLGAVGERGLLGCDLLG